MARKDGKRIKGLSGMGQLIMDINPLRIGSEVYMNQTFDVTELVAYTEKKKETNPDFTLFHAFVGALGKTIYSKPKLNYFVADRHLYEHNDVVISFVAKVAFDDKSEEMMIMIPIKEHDNVDDISKIIYSKVHKVRNSKKEKSGGANGVMEAFGKLPNIVRVPLVGFFKWTDKKGLLPLSFQDDNLYYSSMIVSNLGSIKCDAIYHHLSDFGTCSSLATIGIVKDDVVVIDGKQKIRKVCNFGMTLDERIADGFYFAKAVNTLQYIFSHPELLDEDMSKKVEFKVR